VIKHINYPIINRFLILAGIGFVGRDTTARTDICSSAIAPCIALPPASLQSCNICIYHVHVDYVGDRAPTVDDLGDAEAIADRKRNPAKWIGVGI